MFTIQDYDRLWMILNDEAASNVQPDLSDRVFIENIKADNHEAYAQVFSAVQTQFFGDGDILASA